MAYSHIIVKYKMEYLNNYLARLEQVIQKYPPINCALAELEKKSNVKKVYLAAGITLNLHQF